MTLTLDLLILKPCHVMPLGWSIRVPSLNMIRLTVPELGRLKFSIDCQLSPNFYVFGGKGGQISNLIFLTPKRHFWRERRIMTYWACPKMRPVGLTKKGKKRTETFMRFMKIGPGVSELWGSKIALSHWQCPWLIQQLVLPYKPWCRLSAVLHQKHSIL